MTLHIFMVHLLLEGTLARDVNGKVIGKLLFGKVGSDQKNGSGISSKQKQDETVNLEIDAARHSGRE